jgi:uncharacterized protein (DUF302 family)
MTMTTPTPDVSYGYTRLLPGVAFDDAIQRMTEALTVEGFGVLTRIDVHDTLKAKLGVSFRKFTILGACNPKIAHQALTAELGIGLLLPCNVTVYVDDAGTTVVQVAKPQSMFQIVGKPGMEPLVEEADGRLKRALAAA